VGKKKNRYTKAITYRLKAPFKTSLIATQNNAFGLIPKSNAYDDKGAMVKWTFSQPKSLEREAHPAVVR
jgi:hypothetical protein